MRSATLSNYVLNRDLPVVVNTSVTVTVALSGQADDVTTGGGSWVYVGLGQPLVQVLTSVTVMVLVWVIGTDHVEVPLVVFE